MLLQCVPAESILRLDRTELRGEAAEIQEWYMRDQQHENLLQYLDHQLSNSTDQSLLIQVHTT